MLILTSDEILCRGLLCAGFGTRSRAKRSTRLRRFRAYYGSDPIVYADLIDDLRLTDDPAAWVDFKSLFRKIEFRIAI